MTPKHVTSWRGPYPSHCAWATQLLSKKCRSGGEPLPTLCQLDRPQISRSKTNALPFDQLASWKELKLKIAIVTINICMSEALIFFRMKALNS